jgi:hypothetical protein
MVVPKGGRLMRGGLLLYCCCIVAELSVKANASNVDTFYTAMQEL